MSEARSPRVRTILRYALTAVVLVAVGWLFWLALAQNWEQVQQADLRPNLLMVVAVVVFAAAVPVSGLLWGVIVTDLAPDARVTARDAVEVHSASWLLKYIPGQVGSLVNKVVWGGRRGISRMVILISFIYENVFLQIVSIVPSLVIIALSVGVGVLAGNVATAIVVGVALVPLIAVLDRRIFRRLLDLATRRLTKQPLPVEYFLPTRRTAALLAGFTVPRIINGVGIVLVAASITAVPATDWLLIGAAYALAGALGILAFFVPSGLGVREAVLFACLVAAGYSAADAVLISLLARLLSTIADAVLALLYALLRILPRKEPTA
ncbi:lysylphosphatidylglycerol synthase domain-containing protein [Microcella humidisoli]|uniref:Flippase-like domain-containing protein n=1 Tax=Microcella humidisoli TaxID=2963406 RepID=A0ABY5FYT7_9MICO|nr:lysylphosphatidylglycerol synthase domain-containing protein [Microcella humidisoli]UTT63020.1 flippase-like domain-containing protein [Microcella humidisoli]